MKTKSLDREIEKAGRSYDADLYGWVEDQVALLKADQLSDIDIAHLANELTDMGRSEFEKLSSSARIILRHLLKWDHQPDRRSRSWMLSIDLNRERITNDMRENPSFRNRTLQVIENVYGLACREAARETGLPISTFPEVCVYDWDDITRRPIAWADETSPGRWQGS